MATAHPVYARFQSRKQWTGPRPMRKRAKDEEANCERARKMKTWNSIPRLCECRSSVAEEEKIIKTCKTIYRWGGKMPGYGATAAENQ